MCLLDELWQLGGVCALPLNTDDDAHLRIETLAELVVFEPL